MLGSECVMQTVSYSLQESRVIVKEGKDNGVLRLQANLEFTQQGQLHLKNPSTFQLCAPAVTPAPLPSRTVFPSRKLKSTRPHALE